jgi:N-acetylmuramoyl-L-alanine amidase
MTKFVINMMVGFWVLFGAGGDGSCVSTDHPENYDIPAYEEPAEEVEYESTSLTDVELIALVTMAEAEGESEYGKRLVIDTILNRMDHPYYPSTAEGVIYQSGQFTSMWNGRVDMCYVDPDICRLVEEELANRTNYDVIYFCAGWYSAYGTPLFQEGGHYFSSF